MKRTAFILIVLAILSAIAGILFSHASLAGRTGITLFFRQYHFLNVWWQAALAVFAVWLALWGLHRLVHRLLGENLSRTLHVAALMAAGAGLYFTYYDFRHHLSHRLLGGSFHLGGYLFWIGWMLISLSHLWQKKSLHTYSTAIE
ncbi:cytochrome d ubiquinol oxidase subunit II [Paraflavisolibacter sp. H34]|uniref:cytochrome d ubiquinol oxidase subunit II n=1 Tax=Huijunlia imazamoxiresistens TaxID=3127457 RepID=UPI00301B1338